MRSDPHQPPWLPFELASQLLEHPWRGNVRELQNAVRQTKFGSRYEKYLKKLWRENQIEVMPKYKTFLVVSPLDPDPGA